MLLALLFLPVLFSPLNNQLVDLTSNQFSGLAPQESEIVAQIDGTNAYNYDLELEKIALNHSIPNYAFRSAGSKGASEAAQWIKTQFESFGLEVSLEPFEFTSWNLLSQPSLIIDDDGNNSTISDQKIIKSFQSEQYSWPTRDGGVFKDLVILPLPEAPTQNAFGKGFINSSAWNAINTTGKILLVGREILRSLYFQRVYVDKLRLEPPAAVIYTYWYEWMSASPVSSSSTGGRPISYSGPYYWDLKIPVGCVSYEDGLWIRNREHSVNVSVSLTIPAVIGSGLHYNVVGKLKGSANIEKTIIISSHYDTVMTSGFCDNGAGTAGVIELARVFANAAKEGLYKPEETLLFICFTGEELGLVGSINYVRQHREEMKDIRAVINLDSIGSDNFNVTETFPNDDGLDLDEIVLKAAEDLGIEATLEETTGGDNEPFRTPMMGDDTYYQLWRLQAGVSNATRVKASTTLESYPLFFTDQWNGGPPGWIHTQYDNSTSSHTLQWVEVDDLEAQVQVAALSVMRVLSDNYGFSLWQNMTFIVVLGAVLALVVCFGHSKVRPVLKKPYDEALNYIGMKESIYIIILTGLLLFISFVGHTRTRRVEVMVDGFPTGVNAEYFGYPFEMVGLLRLTPPSIEQMEMSAVQIAEGFYKVSIEITWTGLILNIVSFSLMSLVLVYTLSKVRDIYEAKKSRMEV